MPYADPAKRRAANLAAVRRYRERHPDRVKQNQANQDAKRFYADQELRARRIAQKAKAYGRLVPEPCLFCDDPKVEMHYHDYSKPLEVTWLCPRHHAIAHREIAPIEEEIAA